MLAPAVSPVRAYGVAVLAFLVAILVRMSIDPWLGRSVPFLLFFPAIMVAARYGGFGPGVVATALSAIAAVVRYLDPLGSLSLQHPADVLAVMLFCAIGTLIASMTEAVRRAERDQGHFVAIVESSDDAIVGKNLDGVITSWNLGAERLFGYTAPEAVGQSIALIIPSDRWPEEEQVLRRIRAGERVEAFDTVRRRKNGEEVEVSISVSPISDRAGAITGASKIARDITDRRRMDRVQADLVERQRTANEEATAARDRLAFLAEVGAVLSSSLDYEQTLDRAVHLALPRLGDYCNVMIQDDHGRLRHVAWGHVVPEKEPLLRDLARFLIESPAAGNVPIFADRIIKSGTTLVVTHALLVEAMGLIPRDVPAEILRLGEQIQPYAYMGVPLFVRGRVVGVMAFGTAAQEAARDYTEIDIVLLEEFARRVSLAVENARLFRHADELNRLKDEFLATLSHELRTPLSAVLGWSRMLGTGQLDAEKSKKALAAIERNAHAQAKIVDDILDVARGMGGDLRLDLKSFDLVSVAQRAVEAVTPAAAAKQIEIDLRTPPSMPIIGDPNRLQQVAWNLMSNALKFTPAGGRVTIDVSTDGDFAELCVADTGMGIAPGFLPYVFDKFRQADGSFARQQGGLGLGLAIARHLVELHGGSIEARSAGEGAGATFVVRLPLALRGV